MDGESFFAEHMHHESSRKIRTLNMIGAKVDESSKSYHVASGVLRSVQKVTMVKKVYQYCPSSEGLLPSWLEQEDHLNRWLKVCFEIFSHPDGRSYTRFPVQLIHAEFPEIVDIDNDTYFHAYWATYESIKAYGFDKHQPWERNLPTLLHQLGAMQQFIPYHQAVNSQKYQAGNQYEWNTGRENNSYAKDLFDLSSSEPIPKAPALRLRKDLDGTCSPSYDGMEDLRPQVNYSL